MQTLQVKIEIVFLLVGYYEIIVFTIIIVETKHYLNTHIFLKKIIKLRMIFCPFLIVFVMIG
jgi:hypothetical protein